MEELGASTSYLDQGTVMRHLGRHAFARIGLVLPHLIEDLLTKDCRKLKIAGWLADQEVKTPRGDVLELILFSNIIGPCFTWPIRRLPVNGP